MVDVIDKSGNQDIDALLWGYSWGMTVLSYAFPETPDQYLNGGYASIYGFQALSSSWQSTTVGILGSIETFTGLTIMAEAPENIATFRFGGAVSLDYTDDPAVARYWGSHYPGGSGTAEGNPPELAYNGSPPVSAPYAQGDVWFYLPNYTTISPGTYGYTAGIMHEIGHALGLKHGHVTQSGHGVEFPKLPNGHDSFEYSVMTYKQYVGDMTAGDSAYDHPTSYMQDDIAALQYLYGANFNHNSGDTTYSWDPASGAFSVDGTVVNTPWENYILMTVWDGGGVDTYDFSSYTTDLRINLAPGAFSIVSSGQLANLGDGHFARGNIANALLYNNDPGSLIENVIGGSGNDFISGNAADNSLRGGDGNDRLLGGDGNDILDGETGADAMRGGAGDDTYYRDNAGDIVTEDADAGIDTVSASVTTALSANVENLILTGSDSLRGIGNDLDNVVVGNSGANILKGMAGADTIYGDLGNDTLFGGAGNDTFVFDTALDKISNVDRIGDFSIDPGDYDLIALDVLVFSAFAEPSFTPRMLFATEFASGDNIRASTADQHILYDTFTNWLFYDADGNGSGRAVHFATLNTEAALSFANIMVF